MHLDSWVAEKISIGTNSGGENIQVLGGGHENKHEQGQEKGHGQENGQGQEPFKCVPLTREALDTYSQTKRVKLLAFLMEKSPFYKTLLTGIIASTGRSIDTGGAMDTSVAISNARNLASKWEQIPFTTANDIVGEEGQMLCVHPSEISRIVSQTTSGTTGPSKRIYFTPEDQELTVDYFHHGMKIMVAPGDKVLILLPHKSPGSLGFLLQEGLFRLGGQGFFMDSLETLGEAPSFVRQDAKVTPSKLARAENESDVVFHSKERDKIHPIKVEEVTAIVGPPSLIVAMTKTHPDMRPHSILMTADFVAIEDREAVKDAWGSRVFEHYGMTEMGLGCAMSCRDTDDNPPVGYHIRENDLYIEIIDPVSKKNLPDGEWGEIVMTTLTRRGMPFLRYRTGDTGRLLKETCTCGSLLKRLDRVQKRIESKNINY